MISSYDREKDKVGLKRVLVPKEEISGERLEDLIAEIVAEGQTGTIDDAEKLFYNLDNAESYEAVLPEMHQMFTDIRENSDYIAKYGEQTEEGFAIPLTKEFKTRIIDEDNYFESVMKKINEDIIVPKYKEQDK